MRHETTQLRSPLLALLASSSDGQQVQWLNAAPMGWDMNFEMPGHLIQASRNGQVSVARQFGDGMSFGQDIFNSVMVERIDPATGLSLGGCPLTDSVLVESMVVGDDGITYVAGRFMGAIQFCDGSALGKAAPDSWTPTCSSPRSPGRTSLRSGRATSVSPIPMPNACPRWRSM
ncbi:MAG: hypothetical protein IPH53_07690 [Flavobacteriales bacterium]|nr:hypothetical protein [Flavobacteriales bacterium]